MEAKLKVIVSEVLLFSTIGFVIYLLAIVASFMGCCLGVTQAIFNQILIGLTVIGVTALGACSYFICFRKKPENC